MISSVAKYAAIIISIVPNILLSVVRLILLVF